MRGCGKDPAKLYHQGLTQAFKNQVAGALRLSSKLNKECGQPFERSHFRLPQSLPSFIGSTPRGLID